MGIIGILSVIGGIASVLGIPSAIYFIYKKIKNRKIYLGTKL